jgi:hypothetical protein
MVTLKAVSVMYTVPVHFFLIEGREQVAFCITSPYSPFSALSPPHHNFCSVKLNGTLLERGILHSLHAWQVCREKSASFEKQIQNRASTK